MSPELSIAAAQLERMRGMNAAYHRRFFADLRFAFLVIAGLFAAGALGDGQASLLFLLIPVAALIGACQTAFDAYYLIFSRHYSARLERYINARLGEEVLVAHRMEETYMFPLRRPKMVTLAVGGGFTWFGFMTVFYTSIGAAAYLVGLWLGIDALGPGPLRVLYLLGLGVLTLSALATGGWWFVAGAGERRLARVLDAEPDA